MFAFFTTVYYSSRPTGTCDGKQGSYTIFNKGWKFDFITRHNLKRHKKLQAQMKNYANKIYSSNNCNTDRSLVGPVVAVLVEVADL